MVSPFVILWVSYPMNKTRGSILMVLISLLAFGRVAAALDAGPAPGRDARLKWWREARFGMFIHWGIYSQLGRGEWVQFNEKIPGREYEKLAATFNPAKFDADQWVKLARDAGMKYIVITAKHHDGFSMFRTKLSPFNIVDATPFKRDPMAELAVACQKYGLKLCFYYSHVREWHNPLAQSFEGTANYGNFWDYPDESRKDLGRFVDEFAKPQLKELLTQYGPIGLIWFDTPGFLKDEKAGECVDWVHSIQPDCLVNSRVGGLQTGWDYASVGDSEMPRESPGGDWESPITDNDSWGYNSDPNNRYKPPGVLIRMLAKCAGMGGNMLLNVGPTGEGIIPPPAAQQIEAVGAWMRTNGESIYGTQASPFKRLGFGTCTQKTAKLYFHVFDWPQKELSIPGLKNKIEGACLLSDPERKALAVTQTGDDATVSLPSQAPDKFDSVVVLSITGPAEVAGYTPRQKFDGSVSLPAVDAKINGRTARYESDKDSIGYWTQARDWVSWNFRLKRAANFEVQVTYACDEAYAGSEYVVEVAGKSLTGRVKTTGGWSTFLTDTPGSIRLDAAGDQSLAVRATVMPKGAVMNLKTVVLKPL